jgi:glycosyltransferase involved in cell wall biosynthesis
LRVFIGLTEVAGYFGNLAKGMGELGIETKFVDLYAHPFQYAGELGDRDRLVDLYRALSRHRARVPAGRRWAVLWWAGLQKACALGILLKAVLSCNVFIFSSDTTFLRYRDLWLLKLLGKRLIFVFSGSDHRPPYMDGVAITALDDETISRAGDMTMQVKAKLRKIERHADVIVGHHLSGHLHERRIVPFLLLGIPFATATGPPPIAQPTGSGAVRIVHAPSTPRQKGTHEIRQAVEALRAEGHTLEFVELVNRPNQIVLDELARCDFVVDELYSDSRMAGLSTEAAFFGKPTVVAGYARDEDMAIDGVYPPSSFAPVEHCQPDQLVDAIRKLITDVPYRLELGQRARDFVTREWSPKTVAQRYLALIGDSVPDSWMFDPRDIRYVAGTGIPKAVTKAAVRRLVELRGVDALCVSDKKELEAALLAFAEQGALEGTASAERFGPQSSRS